MDATAQPQPNAEAPAHAPLQPVEPERLGLVIFNLSILVFLGVGITAWVLTYTDWFPVVGGLLGLGGLFTWIAFVAGLITDKRKKQFQERFEHRVLESSQTSRWLAGFGAGFLLSISGCGTVVLQAFADEHDRVVTLGTEQSRLPGRTVQKYPVWVGWRGKFVRVKVSGLPALEVKITPFARRPLAVPGSFTENPVVLIRPSPRVSSNAANGGLALEAWLVRRSSGARSLLGKIPGDRYRGEAVWVGCDADVAVPETLVGRWRLELVRDRIDEAALLRLFPPSAIAEEWHIEPGDRIQAVLVRADLGVYVLAETTVRPSTESFIHEIYLAVPTQLATADSEAVFSEGGGQEEVSDEPGAPPI